jgi:uncharacterized protein (UPF0332 family)
VNDERKALVRYRLEMAQSTLKDAQLLHEQGGSLWSVVNRAYYAMFYTTLALLTLIGQGTSKHGGVIALFDQHFVKPGIFPQEMSKWLHKAFDLRQIGDYRELMALTDEQAEEVLEWAKDFVAQVEAFLTPKLEERNPDAR